MINFSVFTKPWKDPIDRLGERVARFGFDGIELPVRPGYPVTPETVHTLPAAVASLRAAGVDVFSIAGPLDEPTFAACAEAGVPMVRVMAPIGAEGYLAAERALQQKFSSLEPLLRKYGIKIGVQNHYGRFIANASGLRSLVSPFDPVVVGIVWDAAHNALNGEEMEVGIELAWTHLSMVNFKNAIWVSEEAAEPRHRKWKPFWTTGPDGLASWPRVAAELTRRNFSGVICLTAEYTEEERVDEYIVEDLRFARSLFEGG